MSPEPSSPHVRRRMENQRRRDTGPEMRLRSRLHAAGLRYRVDHRLPGMRARADVAFTRLEVAVFVDGCFWHGCPVHRTHPKANGRWWRHKIDENIARDRRVTSALAEAGWRVVRIWEHESVDEAFGRVVEAVRSAQAADPGIAV